MIGEQEKILQMLEEGTISEQEAQDLLGAIEKGPGTGRLGAQESEWGIKPHPRKEWKKYFGFFLLSTTLWGTILLRTRRWSGLLSSFRSLTLKPLAFFSAFGAIFIFLAKDGPWLHVRVRSVDQQKANISVPFPLNVLRGTVQVIRSQIEDDDAGEKFDVISEFLEAVETANLYSPITVDLEDEGQNIEVFLD